MSRDQSFGTGNDMADLAVVDPARRADQRRVPWRAVNDEPRIDGNAVAANTRAGLQDVDPRMAVGQPDHFPDVQPHAVRHDRQFVGEGNVDVAIGVLDQLGHLGRAGIGGDAGSPHETLVEGQGLAGAARSDAPDRTVVVDQFLKDAARQHAFRAIGDGDIGGAASKAGAAQVRPQFGDQIAQGLRRADRRGRFQDDHVAGLEHRGNRAPGRQHEAEVGGVVGIEWRRHGNDENIGWLHRTTGGKQAATDDSMDQTVEIGLLDVDRAPVDRLDHLGRNIDAQHPAAGTGDHRRRRQADIAQPDDADVRRAFRFHVR